MTYVDTLEVDSIAKDDINKLIWRGEGSGKVERGLGRER